MTRKLLKIVKVIFFVIIIITFIYGIFGQICLEDERTEDMFFCKPLDTRWYRVLSDGCREEIKLPMSDKIVNANKDVVETVLYDEIDRGACISIRSSKQDIKVYIDNELRKSYSTKDTRLFGKNSVSRYHFIELDKEDAGKTLRIEISSESQYLGTVKQVYYGDKMGIWLNYIKNNLVSILIPFITFTVALVAVVISIVYYLKTKRTVSVFYYAVAVMLISMWIIFVSGIRQLIFNNITSIHEISFVFATIYVVPLSIYVNRLQKNRYELIYSVYSIIALSYCII